MNANNLRKMSPETRGLTIQAEAGLADGKDELENVAGYGEYLHGEAVAIGLGLATRLSAGLGQIPESDIEQVEEMIKKFGLPVRLNQALQITDLMAAMQRDKKNRGGQLRFVTMTKMGTAVTTDDVDNALIEELWRTVGAG